jgi:hypothetical protein
MTAEPFTAVRVMAKPLLNRLWLIFGVRLQYST